MRNRLTQVLLLVAVLTGYSQEVERENLIWLQYYGKARVSGNWHLLADGGFRWSGLFETASQHIVRLGAGYDLNERWSVAAGGANLGFYNDTGLQRLEWRTYQDFNHRMPLGSVKLSQRLRVEQRFFYRRSQGNTVFDTRNVRFRYLIMAGIPVWRAVKDGGISLIFNVGNEVFFNAGWDIVYNSFDQNRVLLSPTLRWSEGLSTSLTWNILYGARNQPDTYYYNNIIWIQIRHRITD